MSAKFHYQFVCKQFCLYIYLFFSVSNLLLSNDYTRPNIFLPNCSRPIFCSHFFLCPPNIYVTLFFGNPIGVKFISTKRQSAKLVSNKPYYFTDNFLYQAYESEIDVPLSNLFRSIVLHETFFSPIFSFANPISLYQASLYNIALFHASS